jgi:2-polyprenyl-3-methyl-5-hydroxy-6-metoxy-1,4-benzoquinol methylase
MDLREIPTTPGRRHPWELARFRFFHDVLQRSGCLAGATAILDAGAGDAWFSSRLLERCHAHRAVLWDAGYDPQVRAQLDVHDARVELVSERPHGRFDLVLALDVLEHVADDGAFLRQIVDENLAPGGHMLISVPAWQALMTEHDHLLGHHRRYSFQELRDVIAHSGLRIERAGGLFHSLLLARAAALLRERSRQSHQTGRKSRDIAPLRWDHGALVTRGVYAALRLDNHISRLASSFSLAVPGLSAWALCRR